MPTLNLSAINTDEEKAIIEVENSVPSISEPEPVSIQMISNDEVKQTVPALPSEGTEEHKEGEDNQIEAKPSDDKSESSAEESSSSEGDSEDDDEDGGEEDGESADEDEYEDGDNDSEDGESSSDGDEDTEKKEIVANTDPANASATLGIQEPAKKGKTTEKSNSDTDSSSSSDNISESGEQGNQNMPGTNDKKSLMDRLGRLFGFRKKPVPVPPKAGFRNPNGERKKARPLQLPKV
jgi:hypothetical protein